MTTNPIDFSVRPNKNIERKLIVDTLLSLSPKLENEIKDYRYLGMGSFWFADFLLFHKRLLISQMVSIEREQLSKRAEFNKPLDCIEVLGGDLSDTLPTVDFDSKETMVWLDYDGQLDCGVFDDISVVLGRDVQKQTILIVTVNSNNTQIADRSNLENAKDSLLKLGVPANLIPHSSKIKDFSKKNFPGLVNQILFNACIHQVLSSRYDKLFFPFLNLTYADGAPMSTIAGVLIDKSEESEFQAWADGNELDFQDAEEAQNINAPLLTLREKILLDSVSPVTEAIEEHSKSLREELSFDLGSSALGAYQRYYRYYPMFAEWDA